MLKIADIGEKFGYGTINIFDPWEPTQVGIDTLKEAEEKIKDLDLIVFGGGEDIHPSLYNHSNVASHCGNYPSGRDIFEMEVHRIALKHHVPMLGICRGSQFLCAMAGGALIQDVDNHGLNYGHEITTNDGRTMEMTSTHHQMMYPGNADHVLLAWAKQLGSFWSRDTDKIPNIGDFPSREPEVVYFPKINALAVQGHPEYYRDVNAPPVEYVRSLVSLYLGVNA